VRNGGLVGVAAQHHVDVGLGHAGVEGAVDDGDDGALGAVDGVGVGDELVAGGDEVVGGERLGEVALPAHGVPSAVAPGN
jgi:hypothetical protein